MKKILLLLVPVLLFASCNKWLDVNPALEMREKDAFATEQGFEDLLIGAYTRMASTSLYGKNTTVLLPELIVQHWTMSGTPTELTTALKSFDYTATVSKSLLETVWVQYYQTIVNLNALLANIDERKEIFSAGNYELCKGEALALRAFLHFEVLRLWAPISSEVVLSESAVPYVRTVTKNPADLTALSYERVLELIIEDLDAAEQLLTEDPILSYTNAQLNSPSNLQGAIITIDDFHYFRQVRFNIYACKALRARYYQFVSSIPGHEDMSAQAAACALEVINARNGDGTGKFALGSESEANLGRLTFPTEHIFAVSNSLSTATLKPTFQDYNTAYTQSKTNLDRAFESTLHTSDIRYRGERLFRVTNIPLFGDFNFFRKFSETETTIFNDMPLMRLSELYFIAIECTGDATLRDELFRTWRISRVMDASIDGTLTDATAVRERLEKEYRKEFYGEGQLYYFYKRHNYAAFTWPAVLTVEPENMKLPLPDSQLLFEEIE